MANKRGKGESSDRFPFLGLQNHYGWWLQPWNQKTIASCRKVMTNLDTMLKSRDITLLTKVHIVKAMVFPVVTYDLWELDRKEGRMPENWWLWTVCWRRLLKVPWTARRSNQSILREINPEYSQKGLMLKLKLQYFSHLMHTDNSLEKSLMLGKIKGRRREGHQRIRWLAASSMQWTWTWANSGRWWGTGRPGVLQSMGSQRDMTEWLKQQTDIWYHVKMKKEMATHSNILAGEILWTEEPGGL